MKIFGSDGRGGNDSGSDGDDFDDDGDDFDAASKANLHEFIKWMNRNKQQEKKKSTRKIRLRQLIANLKWHTRHRERIENTWYEQNELIQFKLKMGWNITVKFFQFLKLVENLHDCKMPPKHTDGCY